MKVLLRDSLADPSARERFRREAHVLSRLSHPNVATIFDFDTQDGVDFLVMEYVPGGTLQSRLREGPIDLEQLTRIGQIASRASILSLLVLFALGAILLWQVKDGSPMTPERQPPAV